MDLTVGKFNHSTGKPEVEKFKISSYQVICQNSTLLLVREGEMGVINEDKTDTNFPHLEIYKVQFIAACKTALPQELVVAFYMDKELDELTGHIIGGLPASYALEVKPFQVIDYQGYLDICELTGETKLSFIDYYNALKKEDLEINSLLIHNGKSLNRDAQIELHGR